jgi:hypothetical protein
MYIDHNHASMIGTYLGCPGCHSPRFAKKSQDGRTGQEVWYLGCECPAPSGLITLFNLARHRAMMLSPKEEVIRYLKTQVMKSG